MRKNFNHLDRYRIFTGPMASGLGDHFGAFKIPFRDRELVVIVSDGVGFTPVWEHVSVSMQNRCPNWPEMCHIKLVDRSVIIKIKELL